MIIGFTITMVISSTIGLISTTDVISSGSGGVCHSLGVDHNNGFVIHRCIHRNLIYITQIF